MLLIETFLRLPFILIIFTTIGYILFFKYKKTGFFILPLLFLSTLYLNKLFTFKITPFEYSFDWEKIVISNPNNIRLIENFWHENLWMFYRIRNLFYSYWLLGFSWLDLIFKLLSPIFLIRVLGYSGFFLFFLGVIRFIKDKNRKWQPVLWILTVTMASGLGILVDSRKAIILAIPAIINFIFWTIKQKNFNNFWVYWVILFLIDLILI